MISKRRSWLGLAAFAAIMACGGGGGGGDGPTSPTNPNNPGAPAASASVAMNTAPDVYGVESNTFSPASVTIARNGVVTWVNGTGTTHNVTFAGSGAPANIADHSSGSNARTFASAGTFSYQCTNHSGMTGSVTVQ